MCRILKNHSISFIDWRTVLMKNIYVIGKEILNIFPFHSHIMHVMTDKAHEGLNTYWVKFVISVEIHFMLSEKWKESLNFSLWFLIGTLQHIQKLIVKTLLHYECIFYNLITTNQTNTLVVFLSFWRICHSVYGRDTNCPLMKIFVSWFMKGQTSQNSLFDPSTYILSLFQCTYASNSFRFILHL